MGKTAYRLNQLGVDGVTAEHIESTMVYLAGVRADVSRTAQFLRDTQVDSRLAIQLARTAWWLSPAIPDRYRRILDARIESARVEPSTPSPRTTKQYDHWLDALKAELAVPPGYTYEKRGNRYRNVVNGQWVTFRVIFDVLNANQEYSATVLTRLCTALKEQKLDAQTWLVAMQTQLRILHIQNAALGSGGFDTLSPGDFMRIDAVLRQEVKRLEKFASAIVNTGITQAQIDVRCAMYAGTARKEFYRARKLPVLEYGQVVVERRVLGIAEHCSWCSYLADLGWQIAGVLPVPGESSATWQDDQCLSNCKCDLVRKIVTREQAEAMIKTPVTAVKSLPEGDINIEKNVEDRDDAQGTIG